MLFALHIGQTVEHGMPLERSTKKSPGYKLKKQKILKHISATLGILRCAIHYLL